MRSDDEPQQTPEREIEDNGSSELRDYFMERDGERFAGLHVIVDLKGAARLNDIGHIEATLRACVAATGATLLHVHLHHFAPGGGVSGIAVLAESHMSIHTWPEAGFAAVDIFMCGDTRPENVVPVLQKAFATTDTQVQQIRRGRGV